MCKSYNFRLYLIEDFPNDWFGIKPIDAVIKLSILVINGSIGERPYPKFLAKSGIPVAIEFVDGKSPMILMFKLIEDVFEVAAVDAVGSEELDYLV